MTLKKYSKSTSFYLDKKKDFFKNNDALIKKTYDLNVLYAAQEKRTHCKLCAGRLPSSVDFHSHQVDYVFCVQCHHLNGVYEDTQSFVKKLYMSDGGAEYSKNYIDDHFIQRTTDIYIPKVDFLITSLPPSHYQVLDVGCGSGYFIYACLLRNISAYGIDVSKVMVEYGNTQIRHSLDQTPLKNVDEKAFFDEITHTKADIISAIGLIEHLREPQHFFEAFRQSKAKYLYYSVPMFSLSVALENVMQNVFPRQLSSGHTHLFTKRSIKKMNALLGVDSVAEWWFGTDIMDVFRHLLVNLQKNKASQKMIDNFYEGFGTKIDDMQSVLDKNHFCSEIHLIAEKQ